MEAILEGLQTAVDEIRQEKEHGNPITEALFNNLQLYVDRVYAEWEKQDDPVNELIAVKAENRLLRELLRENLTHAELADIRICYGIDLEWED